jgi:adenosylhomocysteine nucleosidase
MGEEVSVLVVAALEAEVQHLRPKLRDGDSILVTGCGKVNAAYALTAHLTYGFRTLPDLILNVGTAGGLSEWAIREEVVQVHVVVQADFDTTILEQVIGMTFGSPIHLVEGSGTGYAKLATSDRFVTNPRQLAKAGIDICDMEAYALAHVAYSLNVPFRCVKAVSDPADDTAIHAWPGTVARCSRLLAEWYEGNICD